MAKLNNARSGCRDVFHAFLVENARFDSDLEIPCLSPENALPERVIAFSKAVSGNDYDQWVHFYEDDVFFERLWNNPKRYLPILKKY